MARLDTDKQKELEPKRMAYAISEIEKLGYKVTQVSETELRFEHTPGHLVYFFPYSGWASGVTINDGRGLAKLLKQIK